MKKQYLISLLTVLLAVMMLLSGCGGRTGSDASGIKTASIWLQTASSKQFWESKIADFNNTLGKELGVKLELDVKIDSSYSQELDIAIQSGQLPEFFMWGDIDKLVEAGDVVALNTLPGLPEFYEKYADMMVEKSHKLGENVYCIPWGMTTRGLVYNKEMFVAAGLVDENGEAKPPKTLTELREYAKILTNPSKNQYGIVFPLKWASWVDSDIVSLSTSIAGMPEYNPEKGVFDYSVCKPMLETVMGIKEDGSYYPGAEGLDNDPARARFSEGNIGMKIAYSFDVGVFNTQFPAKIDWGVAPLPALTEDNPYRQTSYSNTSVRVASRALETLGAENVSKIFQWLYSDETVVEMYKQGLEIPCDWNLVKDVAADNMPTGWKEFCEMADISVIAPTVMPVSSDGAKSVQEVIVNEVWTGEKSIDEGLAEMSQIKNDGMKKYQELYPEQDYSIYYDASWSEKVRRD